MVFSGHLPCHDRVQALRPNPNPTLVGERSLVCGGVRSGERLGEVLE
jgi:hypothetical protein